MVAQPANPEHTGNPIVETASKIAVVLATYVIALATAVLIGSGGQVVKNLLPAKRTPVQAGTAITQTTASAYVEPGVEQKTVAICEQNPIGPAEKKEKKRKANDGQVFEPLPTNHRLRVQEVINAARNGKQNGGMNGIHNAKDIGKYARQKII